jgi:predicted NACHT family NTPase
VQTMEITDAKITARIYLMAETAYLLFHGRQELFTTPVLMKAIREASKRLGKELGDDEAATAIDEWQMRDGILVKAGGEGASATYLFQHLTFQEYLTAKAIWRKLDEGDKEKRDEMIAYLSRKAWSPDWGQVFLLLAGLAMDSPKIGRFYRLLMDEKLDDIACCRQVLAAQMLAETVD